jgi:crotonobetainyl-CoA:carnitine CoA-transferase CaiB-like acyl-CoA transferase
VRGHSAYFVWLNRGKESICLNLKDETDRSVLARIIASADVLIQNLKPGALEKLGFSTPKLRQLYPSLIICNISGFGSEGPCSSLKAYDLIVQAEIGLCAITGTEQAPARVGISVCDIAAGVTAHAMILQAIIGRSRTGQGRVLEVSLFDSIADWMNVPLMQFMHGGHEVPRCGVAHPTIAPYGAFQTAAGDTFILAVQNEREWVEFAERVLRRPDLATDARFKGSSARLQNRSTLDALVADMFSGLSSPDAAARLAEAGIAHGRLNGIREASVHPHLRTVSVRTANGEVAVIAPSAAEIASSGRVPVLDEHGPALRCEFGGLQLHLNSGN